MKTADLTGPALDWAVAVCDGWTNLRWYTYKTMEPVPPALVMERVSGKGRGWTELSNLDYSTDWSQGGQIIEREKIGIGPRPEGTVWPESWLAASMDDDAMFYGATPLIAAMRCYVASRLGDEVDVPKELM